MKITVFAACFVLMAQVGVASAADFKSVAAAAAVLYDAPSVRGTKLFVAPHNMPLEVILSYGNWIKVRDASGDLSWIEAGMLGEQRWVVVNVANVTVRALPAETANIVFSADKNVLLEWVASDASGWIKVRHPDGQGGYVKASEVWGE